MRFIPLLLATVLLLAGCGSDYTGTAVSGAEPPARAPDYSGAIVQIAGGSMLVKADGDPCGIWVRPADSADVLVQTIDSRDAVSWDYLKVGSSVDLWIPGGIAESCPMQGRATTVLVLGEPPG